MKSLIRLMGSPLINKCFTNWFDKHKELKVQVVFRGTKQYGKQIKELLPHEKKQQLTQFHKDFLSQTFNQ